ncbi:MAG: hypothetical protein AAFQ64_19680, partial [Pseudomonadota bacterium]
MKNKRLLCMVICVFLSGSIPALSQKVPGDLSQILGKEVSVGDAHEAETPFVYIFPEDHSSILMQVEHAIAMLRLHREVGLKTVVLEGLTIEDGTVEARQEVSPAQVQAALSDLAAGNLGGSEFLSRIGLVELVPAENGSDYSSAKAFGKDIVGPTNMIAHLVLSEWEDDRFQVSDKVQIEVLTNMLELRSAEDDEERRRILLKIVDVLVPEHPVLNQINLEVTPSCLLGSYRQTNYRDQLRALRELQNYAAQSEYVSSALVERLGNDVAFVNARKQTDPTMVATAYDAVRISDVPAALVIGAAHTSNVVQLMRDRGVSLAVLTPRSLIECDNRGKLSLDKYGVRNTNDLIVQNDADKVLQVAGYYGSDGIRPRPALVTDENLEAFQVKDQLYELSAKFAEDAHAAWVNGSGDGNEPPNQTLGLGEFGGGGLPWLQNPADYKRTFVAIDAERAMAGFSEDGQFRIAYPVTIEGTQEFDREHEFWITTEVSSAVDTAKSADRVVLSSVDLAPIEADLLKIAIELKSRSEPTDTSSELTGRSVSIGIGLSARFS